MARRPSKTVVQQDQYEFFTGAIRARFADLGTIGTISWTLTATLTISVLSTLFSSAEDYWLRSALVEVRLPVFLLFACAVLTEFIRGLHWIERKDVFAIAHGIVIIGMLGVVAYLLFQYGAIADNRALERADQARLKAAAEACQQRRSDEIALGTQRDATARAMLGRCKTQFEETKTIFSSSTVENYCRSRYAAVNSAAQELKKAKAYPCPPTETGSLPVAK